MAKALKNHTTTKSKTKKSKRKVNTRIGNTRKRSEKTKFTQMQVIERLQRPASIVVYKTVQRYAQGAYSSIFNQAEMEALAQDIALEVTRRVLIWQKNPRHREAVEPRGCEAYFSKAFINHCQKIYEKYAKTDVRAGVQTVSSDEALAAAAAKNLETPENDWILQQEIDRVLQDLKEIDGRVNELVRVQAEREGRTPRPEELQYSHIILEKTLYGFEPNEIRKSINLSESDYARHRKAALDLAKERLGFTFNDMIEHFSNKEDYRIYTREVKKRKRSPNRQRNYQVSPNFYIQTSMDSKNQTATTSLFVRIDILEDEVITKEVKPKLIKLEEQSSSINNSNQVRELLWSKTKSVEFIKNVKDLGEKYLKSVQKTVIKSA